MADTTPGDGPTTLDLVKRHCGVPSTLKDQDEQIEAVVWAVNGLVSGWPCSEPAIGAEDWSGLPQVVLGATMLAARLHRRRDSVDGVATFGSEGPLYVTRNDPDVALLLGLGQHSGPAVG